MSKSSHLRQSLSADGNASARHDRVIHLLAKRCFLFALKTNPESRESRTKDLKNVSTPCNETHRFLSRMRSGTFFPLPTLHGKAYAEDGCGRPRSHQSFRQNPHETQGGLWKKHRSIERCVFARARISGHGKRFAFVARPRRSSVSPSSDTDMRLCARQWYRRR